ncbi:hypothetical protein [Actinomadura rubrisoli]|uniref:Uncharacterized protein n=1 Tax=Actinomadura rubrisoli TaxID=2530368 RepID=A0A4R5C1Z3_9ACTN|nr:hypothetical protein [Actinomadura rubrisoli]TDD90762.1 hypothetical protein E1298_12740 [Actinomadura rubrisoli]
MSFDKPRKSDVPGDLMAKMYGPVNAVYDEMRANAPLVVAKCVSGRGEPAIEARLRVSYRAEPTRTIKWDKGAQCYVWVGGPDDGAGLGREPRQVAERIAEALGAPFSAPPAN